MNKSHIRKKKAFTLTELLVVVIVIGVLSAVVLPKFSKVLETRKTTEAEELMAAVRTEQEKRCALDQAYLSNFDQVSDIAASNQSKHFTYNLTPTGMEAQSKGKYGYTLKMPSYADGRVCCESEAECAKLNKDYPLCSALIARADYQSGAECAGEGAEPDDPCELSPDSCICSSYAQTHPGECDPSSCEANPNQEKCCAVGEIWNGNANRCETPNRCAEAAYAQENPCECMPNTCACDAYAREHLEECGEEEPKNFYGPDIWAEQFTSDSCPDGDEASREQSRFLCEDHPEYKGSCVDLFSSSFYFDYQDTYASSDTCNGNTTNKFSKTMSQAEKYHKFSCVDVYKETNPSDQGTKQGSWGCSGGRRGGSVTWEGVNGPTASDLTNPGGNSAVWVFVGNQRIQGSTRTCCFWGAGMTSSAKDVCSACTGTCQQVLLATELPDCVTGVGSDTVLRRYFKYRYVNCSTTKARKVTYKRKIGYRKVDCSGNGNIEGTASEDRGA